MHGTNSTDVQIPDLATVESAITISGCAGNASASATVEVHIAHTYIGDLVVTLIAPDGSSSSCTTGPEAAPTTSTRPTP